jgi:hypothetical protein
VSLIPGPDNPALVASYSPEQVRDEARRLANNLRLTGMEYTAAVLERLAK